ncbi:MAG TPA: methyltransferase [Stellaceae bacterium]|jgi:SAM-dependent methyltransferase|nr:methyltransferase [Stellaceae bacterium]
MPTANETNIDLHQKAKSYADVFGVIADIHPNDHMFNFLSRSKTVDEAAKIYFNGGRNNSLQLMQILSRVGIDPAKSKLLEFASGYGRVTRHLFPMLKARRYVAYDIHESAVEFIRERIGAEARLSNSRPESVEYEGTFDFIFVLSLFSHLPDSSFSLWLTTLYNMLSPDGVLLFTTHGESVLQRDKDPRREQSYDAKKGFGFLTKSEQADLNTSEYGTSISAPHYVIPAIYSATGGRIVSFAPCCWFGIQDEWIVRKGG